MFTVGIDVGAGIHVLKKSVKHPRSLAQTCAREGCWVSVGSHTPIPRTSRVSNNVKEERFL
jgi:hypothetical protein